MNGEPDLSELVELRYRYMGAFLRQLTMRENAFEMYKDDAGKPRMRYSAVLFLDSLGTTAASTSSDADTELTRLHTAINHAASQSLVDDQNALQATTWFTDNVVVALPVAVHQAAGFAARHAVVVASELMVGLLQHGVLSRGGLTLGRAYIDDRFVFGPALIEAHDLETRSNEARVLLSPLAATAIGEEFDMDAIDAEHGDPISVIPGWANEALYVNHFNVAFGGRGAGAARVLAGQLDQQLRDGLERAGGSEKAQSKWKWADHLFRQSISRYWPDENDRPCDGTDSTS